MLSLLRRAKYKKVVKEKVLYAFILIALYYYITYLENSNKEF